MKQDIVITISREFGSGGRKLGKHLAQRLEIPFYDKKALTSFIEKDGINKLSVKNIKDHINGAQYYLDIPLKNYVGQGGRIGFIALQERIYRRQKEMIKSLSKESCVIVGRCSQAILEDHPKVIRIFVRADKADKVQTIRRLYNLDEKAALTKMKDVNEKRANYFEYFTNQQWKSMNHYDLVVNTSKLSEDEIIMMMIELLGQREKTSR
ncbi:MAG: AAA family ATPase [Breznakia sp.]